MGNKAVVRATAIFVDQAMTSAGITDKGLALACLLAGLAYDHMPFTGGEARGKA